MTKKSNFYRLLLIITASAYLIFALVYRISGTISDPMSIGERVITVSLFLAVILISFKNKFVKENIDIITFLLSLTAILQLIYYNHQFNFNLGLSIPVIIIVAAFNLIFDLDRLKLIVNFGLLSLIIYSLKTSENVKIINSLYLSSYIIIVSLSLYISYFIKKSQEKLKINLEKLKSQHQFQKTFAKIASELVNLGLDNFDYKINNSLKEIGEYFDIDRSYLFEISDDRKTMSNTYEWTAPGIKAEKNESQSLKTKKYSWWIDQLKNNEIIIIENVDNLGEEAAAEKELFKSQNIKALIVLPIYIKEKLTGFFGFDLVKSKLKLNTIKIEQLKIYIDVIKNALSKHQDNLKIKELSYYDSLTGLYNRRFFEEELSRLDTARQLPISIIMTDLNGLKMINDSYGHKMGDNLLKKAADLVKNSIRREDILARQGGDEFIILLPQTKAEEAAKIIQRIKSNTGLIAGTSVPLSIALGQATKTEQDQSIEETIKDADNQMYKNKLSESRSSKSNVVKGLISALAAKSNETKEHTLRMKDLALKFAERLNLSDSEQHRLSLLAALHDIGKINISKIF